MSRSGIPTLPPPYTHVQGGARESGGSFDFDLAGGSGSEYRGSEEGWGRDVTHWGGQAVTPWGEAAAVASGGSWRHDFDLDGRDLGKEPVRISLAAVCVCE